MVAAWIEAGTGVGPSIAYSIPSPLPYPHLLPNDPHNHNPPQQQQQVDTGAAATTTEAVKLAAAVGTPVRSAGPGYNMPTFFRIAVREPGVTKVCVFLCVS